LRFYDTWVPHTWVKTLSINSYVYRIFAADLERRLGREKVFFENEWTGRPPMR